MSLSSVSSAVPIANVLLGSGDPAVSADVANQVAGADGIGTKGGSAPLNPNLPGGVSEQKNDVSQSQESGADPLASYAATDDNKGKGVATIVDATVTNLVPTAEDFKKIGEMAAQGVTIDPELAEKAAKGDVESLSNLVSGAVTQAIERTIQASVLASNQIANQANTQVQNTVESKLASDNYGNTANQAAVAVDASLGEGAKAIALKAVISDLRTQYPTAPAEILGKEAATRLGYTKTPSSETTDENTEATDWSKNFQF